MRSAARRTITLPADQAKYVDTLVAAGTYRSTSEVVKAGLQALQDRDTSIDKWLREEVAPVYDAMQANPGRAVPIQEIRSAIKARHAAGLRPDKRGA
jgi:antitoxin ParD1/3/4